MYLFFSFSSFFCDYHRFCFYFLFFFFFFKKKNIVNRSPNKSNEGSNNGSSVLALPKPMTIRERLFMLLNSTPHSKVFQDVRNTRLSDTERLHAVDKCIEAGVFGDLSLARGLSPSSSFFPEETKEPIRGTDVANPLFYLCFNSPCVKIALLYLPSTPSTVIYCPSCTH